VPFPFLFRLSSISLSLSLFVFSFVVSFLSFCRLLINITTGYFFDDTNLGDHLIEATNLPHRVWGLDGIPTRRVFTIYGIFHSFVSLFLCFLLLFF
jgi:hypothetical protein